jgi:MoaA/NifB/PqqE/SkfB family radical SAM enzyme
LTGRIAVTYDGQVVPCIFDRSRPLGDVRRQRLREILLAAAPLRLERDRVLAGAGWQHEQLACWECRLRAALLPESTLVTLRRGGEP